MFSLSVVDHVRLSFGHVVQNYTIHVQSAERLARLAWKVKLAVLALLAIGVAVTVAVLLGAGRPAPVVAAVASGAAFVIYAVHVAVGLENRIYAHRSCANRLWLVCERYRALLAEIHDGLLDRTSVLRRRDELLQQVHDVYEHTVPADLQAYETAHRAVQKSASAAFTEEQIDQFLPPSLRKAGEPSEAEAPDQSALSGETAR